RVAVGIGHLDLRDLPDLRLGHRSHLVAVRLSRPLFDPRFLLQQDGRGRRLGDEGEGFVRVDRDLDREDRSILTLRASVELFAERHDVDPLRSKGRTYGRSRIRAPRWNLELYEASYLLCHSLLHRAAQRAISHQLTA